MALKATFSPGPQGEIPARGSSNVPFIVLCKRGAGPISKLLNSALDASLLSFRLCPQDTRSPKSRFLSSRPHLWSLAGGWPSPSVPPQGEGGSRGCPWPGPSGQPQPEQWREQGWPGAALPLAVGREGLQPHLNPSSQQLPACFQQEEGTIAGMCQSSRRLWRAPGLPAACPPWKSLGRILP